MAILNWIQQYNGAITALTAVVVAWLTAVLALENRRLRRAGTEPDVVAYLLPDRTHINFLHLVVANVGRGAARNVVIEINADPIEFADHGIRLTPKKKLPVLSVLPQDERMYQFFGSAIDALKDPALTDFIIAVHFENLSGKKRTNNCRASVIDFEGYGTLGQPPEYEIADALKKIAGKIDSWSSGFQRLKVETITGREERQRQEAAYERSVAARASENTAEKK